MSEQILQVTVDINHREGLLRTTTVGPCCDPRTQWCRRTNLRDAIQHGNQRALVSRFKQYVWRSRAHERPGDAPFWMISSYRPGRTMDGKRRPTRQVGQK